MGYYINPPDKTKEGFLAEYGERVSINDLAITPEALPVILINNGPFTTAVIAYSEKELAAFTSPTDPRPRQYYMVPREALTPYYNED